MLIFKLKTDYLTNNDEKCLMICKVIDERAVKDIEGEIFCIGDKLKYNKKIDLSDCVVLYWNRNLGKESIIYNISKKEWYI